MWTVGTIIANLQRVSGTYRIASASAAGFSHVGRRTNNEDAFCVLPALGLFLVADGMGGYEGGEVASSITIDTIVEYFATAGGETPEQLASSLGVRLGDRSLAEEHMSTALRLAHRAVCTAAVGDLAEMGSTLAGVLLGDGLALVVHVGDSRVYRVRNGVAAQLTRDHSVLADLQAAGCASMLEHMPPHYAHMITRSLSSGADAKPELQLVETCVGDTFLLCTDGLHDVLSEVEISSFVPANSGDVGRAADISRAMCDAAFDAGSSDNITVVTVRV